MKSTIIVNGKTLTETFDYVSVFERAISRLSYSKEELIEHWLFHEEALKRKIQTELAKIIVESGSWDQDDFPLHVSGHNLDFFVSYNKFKKTIKIEV